MLGVKLLECSRVLTELKSEILTLTEVADLIGVSRRTCTNYRNELKIPFVRIDAKTVFFRSEVLKAMGKIDKVSNEEGVVCKAN